MDRYRQQRLADQQSCPTKVFGNPLENLDLAADPGKNFAVIMKDGKIYKNTIK